MSTATTVMRPHFKYFRNTWYNAYMSEVAFIGVILGDDSAFLSVSRKIDDVVDIFIRD